MNSVKKSKVVVIGAGSVGESVAYALAIRGHASEIVIVDIAEDRAIGNALDISKCKFLAVYCKCIEFSHINSPPICAPQFHEESVILRGIADSLLSIFIQIHTDHLLQPTV